MQKPEITDKNTGKRTCQIWPARLSVKLISKLMSQFSGALDNATALTLFLESFARKSDSVAAFLLTLPDPCVFS